MNDEFQCYEVPREEWERNRRLCWRRPKCQRRALLQDWTGYRHCIPCWWRSLHGGGPKWFFLRTTRLWWPGRLI
jgi:hypothetical protein